MSLDALSDKLVEQLYGKQGKGTLPVESCIGDNCGDALANFLNSGPLKDTGLALPRGGVGPGDLAGVGKARGASVLGRGDLSLDNLTPGTVIHMTRQPGDRNYEYGSTHIGIVDEDEQGNKMFKSFTAGRGWRTETVDQRFIDRLPAQITATNPVNPSGGWLAKAGNLLGPSAAVAGGLPKGQGQEDDLATRLTNQLYGEEPGQEDLATKLTNQLYGEEAKVAPAPTIPTPTKSVVPDSDYNSMLYGQDPMAPAIEPIAKVSATIDPEGENKAYKKFLRGPKKELKPKDLSTQYHESMLGLMSSIPGVPSLGPPPPGGYDEMGNRLDAEGRLFTPARPDTTWTQAVDRLEGLGKDIIRIGKDPHSAIVGAAELGWDIGTFGLGLISATAAAVEHLPSGIMKMVSGEGSVLDAYNVMKDQFQSMAEMTDPGKQWMKKALGLPADAADKLVIALGGTPLPKGPSEAVGEAIMLPLTMTNSWFQGVADEIHNSEYPMPNTEGLLRFMGEGTGFYMMAKFHRGGIRGLKKGMDVLGKEINEFRGLTSKGFARGPDMDAAWARLAEMKAGEVESIATEIAKEFDPNRPIIDDVQVAGEEAVKKTEVVEEVPVVVEEAKPKPLTAVERARAKKAKEVKVEPKPKPTPKPKVVPTPPERTVVETDPQTSSLRQDPEVTRVRAQAFDERAPRDLLSIHAKALNDVNRWLDGDAEVSIDQVRRLLSDLAAKVEDPAHDRTMLDMLGTPREVELFKKISKESATWARRVKREKGVKAPKVEEVVPEVVAEEPTSKVNNLPSIEQKLEAPGVAEGKVKELVDNEAWKQAEVDAKVAEDTGLTQGAIEKYYGKSLDDLSDAEVISYMNKELLGKGGGGVTLTIGIDPTQAIGAIKKAFESLVGGKKGFFGKKKEMSVQEIWEKTGFYLNPHDNKWRYYINDSEVKLTPAFDRLEESKLFAPQGEQFIYLDQALDHPRLFDQVPELGKTKVFKQKAFLDIFGSTQGWVNDKGNIYISPGAIDVKATLIHEVTHIIQEKANWAKGGNTSTALEQATPEQLKGYAEAAVGEIDKSVERSQNNLDYYKNKIDKLQEFLNLPVHKRQKIGATVKGHDRLYNEYYKPRENSYWLSDIGKAQRHKLDYYELALKEIFGEGYGTDVDGLYYALKNILYNGKSLATIDVESGLNKFKDQSKYYSDQITEQLKTKSALTNPSDKAALMKALKDSGNVSYDAYKNLAGEIEARDNANRLADPEMQKQLPLTSEEIDPKKVIVSFDKLGNSASAGELYSGIPVHLLGKTIKNLFRKGKEELPGHEDFKLAMGAKKPDGKYQWKVLGLNSKTGKWDELSVFDSKKEARVNSTQRAVDASVEWTKLYREKMNDPLMQPEQAIALKKAERTDRRYDEMKAFKEGDFSKWWDSRKKWWGEAIHDQAGRVRSALLKRFGEGGQRLLSYIESVPGGPRYGEEKFRQMTKEVYDGLSKNLTEVLDRFHMYKRFADIWSYNPEWKAPNGIKRDETMLNVLHFKERNNLSDADFKLIQERSELMFNHARGWVDEFLLDTGIIGPEEAKALKSHDYSKMKYLATYADVFDRSTTSKVGDVKVSNYDSGVDPLGHGGASIAEVDQKIVYNEIVRRMAGRAANQRSRQAMREFATQFPDNGMIWHKGMEGKRPKGWVKDYVWDFETPVESVETSYPSRQPIWLHPDFARQVATVGADMSYRFAWATKLLGTDLVRSLAVGTSAVWATVVNLPIDIMHTFFSPRVFKDGKEVGVSEAKAIYSPFFPKYLAELGSNYIDVASDVWNRGPKYDAYAKYGGLLQFLTQRQSHITGHMQRPGKFDQLLDILSAHGRNTELLTRIGIMDRVVDQKAGELGMTKDELWKRENARPESEILRLAAHVARENMPYGQTGWMVKVLDRFIPFAGANYVGGKTFWRAAVERPADFSARIANIGATAVGITAMSLLYNPKAYREIDDNDKNRNIVIPFLPDYLKFKDSKGEERTWNMKIPGTGGPMFFYNLFAGLTHKFMYEAGMTKVPPSYESIIKSLAQNAPVQSMAPPVISGLMSYVTNYSVWQDRNLFTKLGGKTFSWPQSKVEGINDPNVAQLAKTVGGATGLSPTRLQGAVGELIPKNNEFMWLFGKTYEGLFSGVPEKIQERVWQETIVKTPGVNRLFSLNTPDAYRQTGEASRGVQEEKVEMRNYLRKSEFDLIMEEKARGGDVRDKLRTFYRSVGKEDPEAMQRFMDDSTKLAMIEKMEHKSIWKGMLGKSDELKAMDFNERLKVESSPEEQKSLRRELGRLMAAGFVGEKFFPELGRIRRKDKK